MIGTIIAAVIVFGIIGLIIWRMIKNKKAGKNIQCGGDCSSCGGHCSHKC